MHAAQVESFGEAPRYLEVADPPAPKDGEIKLKVLACGLHQVVRSRAKGQHYSSKTVPHTLGIDGAGIDEATGTTYFFSTLAIGAGSFADYVVIPKQLATPLPDGADPVLIAAFFNPAMSSWMALRKRTNNLPDNFTCLVLGATSASGSIAVSMAKALGAGRVIGVARNAETLGEVHGLDEAIVQRSPVEETDFSNVECDVILDYVYGDLAVHVLSSIRTPRPVQFVQIGMVGGALATIPGALLRSKDLTLRGAGPGSWSPRDLQAADLLAEMAKLRLPKPIRYELSDIATAWNGEAALKRGRPVLIP